MSKATEQELGELHGTLARGLNGLLKDGVDVASGEATVKVTAPAAFWGVAVALLKNNNITADPTKNEELSELNKLLQARRQNARSDLNFREAAEDFATKHLGGDMSMN